MYTGLAGFLSEAAVVFAIVFALNCGGAVGVRPDGGAGAGGGSGFGGDGSGGSGTGGAAIDGGSPDGAHDGHTEGGPGGAGAGGAGGMFGCGTTSCGVGESYCAHSRTGGGIGGHEADAAFPPPPPDDSLCVAYPPACIATPTCACLCQSACLSGDFCQCLGTPPMDIHCIGS